MIDGGLSVVASANISQRSFYLGNVYAIVVLDPGLHGKVQVLFGSHLTQSRRVFAEVANPPGLVRLIALFCAAAASPVMSAQKCPSGRLAAHEHEHIITAASRST